MRRTTITWLGHSAFFVQSPSGKRLLVDPWLDNPQAPKGATEISDIDVILITHGHSDHIGNAVAIAKRTDATVISIYEVYLFLKKKGVSSAMGMNKGGTLSVEGLQFTMTDAKHSSDIDADGTVMPGGEAAGFVIHLENGRRIYHAGDTSVFGDMKLIGQMYKPDVAILPIGGLYTMDPEGAALACTMLKPRTIIGMHYGTFPALAGTPAELKRHLPAPMKKRVRELTPGVPVTL